MFMYKFEFKRARMVMFVLFMFSCVLNNVTVKCERRMRRLF